MRGRQREHGRGERVLPGLWRLRLPCPWPGVPHGNAWAIADGDGFVLVDTGVHAEGSLGELERALDQVGLGLERVTRLVITHAHDDHWGQALPIVQRSRAVMWVHPAAALKLAHMADPEAELRTRLEIARQSGVPDDVLARYAEHERNSAPLFAGPVDAAATRELVNGVRVATDLGEWTVYETPGHALSHVCLHQPDHRLLISGDHLLGRVALHFDRDDVEDPVADFLDSLDIVAGLRARLALSGHGKPFLDVPGHIDSARRAVADQLGLVLAALAHGPQAAIEIAEAIDSRGTAGASGSSAALRVPLTLCLLEHLKRRGGVARERELDDGLERWRALELNLDTLVSR